MNFLKFLFIKGLFFSYLFFCACVSSSPKALLVERSQWRKPEWISPGILPEDPLLIYFVNARKDLLNLPLGIKQMQAAVEKKAAAKDVYWEKWVYNTRDGDKSSYKVWMLFSQPKGL